jgi:tRNA nucleotidyltransferase/poly(A) polymerase
MSLNKVTKEVTEMLNKAGFECFLVGGSVRDMLLNVSINDLDFTTSAKPNEIKESFKGFPVFALGEKFGTITVLFESEKVEITTFRSESNFTEKRNELNVQFETSLIKDLERRDFTINAIAFNAITGEFFDPFNGKVDLKNHVIRFVGNPIIRITEDPLRMLRAVRFADKLNSVIEAESFNAIKVHASLIKNVSFERIREELLKMLSLPDCSLSLELLHKTGLLKEIIPELASLEHVEQPKRFHKFKVMHHCFETANNLPNSDPFLRFVGLLHDIGKIKPRLSSPFFPNHEFESEKLFMVIAKRFKLSIDETHKGAFLIKNHMMQFGFPNIIGNKRAHKRILSKMGTNIEFLSDLFKLFNADKEATGKEDFKIEECTRIMKESFNEILTTKEPLNVKDLAIKGTDLINMGLPIDSTLSKTLNLLLDAVIEEKVSNDKLSLLKMVERLIKDGAI